MAPKHHPTPLSGGDRKALNKELGKARAMTNILAAQSAEMRAKGDASIRAADKLLAESWNERMWADGEPIDPSPTIDQAVNGGFPWLEVRCSRCKTPSDVDLAAMKRPPTNAPRPADVRPPLCCSLLGSHVTPRRGSRLRLRQESSTVANSDDKWTATVQTASAYLETLNPEQRRAVEHGASGGQATSPRSSSRERVPERPIPSPTGSPI
jgi:hypothetical protein